MDSLTHAFTAIAATHALRRGRPSGRTLGAAVLAANVQDVDWLPFLVSPAAGLAVHRGPTHSLLAVPLIGLAAAAAARLGGRARGSVASRSELVALLGVCLVAAASHPAIDLLTPYGLRPFLPFDGRWCYGDVVAVFDPWMWLVLGGTTLLLSGHGSTSVTTWTVLGSGIVMAALHLIPSEGAFGIVAGLVWIAGAAAVLIAWLRGVPAGARRAIAVAGLTLTGLYLGGLAALHQHALARARAVAELTAGGDGERVLRVAAIPTLGDLSTWRGLADTERSVYRFAIPLGRPSPAAVERFASLRDPALGAPALGATTPLTRAFVSFARFGAVEVATEGARRVLLLADLRYDNPRPGEPETWPVREPIGP